MSLKKLIATAAVLVGSSTAALAHPYRAPAPAPRGGVTISVRDHRHPVVVRPRAQVNWYASASYSAQPTYWNEPVYQAPAPVYQAPSLTLMAPSELGARFDLNTINELAGKSTIRLDATGCEGRTFIDKVTIYDINGNYQQVSVNQWLSKSNPTFDIGLTYGAQTARVIVDGQSQLGGTLAVEAV